MKKLFSLIKACMTSDMSLFKIKTNKNKKFSALVPLMIALYLMFMIWSMANSMFEKLEPMNLAYILLPLFAFSISIMTLLEGIYKSGSLIFNCKDDQLLLSLPITRRTVLFIRILKFYVFELLYNSLFLLPTMIAYIRWDSNLNWTYYLTSIIMLLLLPIIPIVISCINGYIISDLSNKFKYKNIAQIVLSMIFLIAIFAVSFNSEKVFQYIVNHSNSINDLITKIYYPAGVYGKLVTNFQITDLLIFIVVNLVIFILAILLLERFYFKINSKLKKVVTNNKTVSIDDLTIKSKTPIMSIIKKEITTFFTTPVLIINAGFSLVLYILFTIIVSINYNGFMTLLAKEGGMFDITESVITNNLSIVILIIISFVSFMTSITNSLISLEGRNINILKSLPVETKKILMGKVLACLLITTPVMFICDIVLFIVMKISIIEAVLLLILSIIIPLVSHFVGIIVNLKYPKLDWENVSEVVKQSTSSFISVMLGMILFIMTMIIIINLVGIINSTLLLVLTIIIYLIINVVLYLYLIKKGVTSFKELAI